MKKMWLVMSAVIVGSVSAMAVGAGAGHGKAQLPLAKLDEALLSDALSLTSRMLKTTSYGASQELQTDHNTRKGFALPWYRSLRKAQDQSVNNAVDAAAEVYEDDRQSWMIMLPFSYGLAFEAFNDCNKQQCLSNLIFGDTFTFGDIHVLSKLSDQSKLSLPGMFGDARSEQYLALLATTTVVLEAEYRELVLNANAAFKHDLGEWGELFVGANLPIKSVMHSLDVSFKGGTLFSGMATTDNTVIEFLKDFESVEDFFISGILEPKGLEWVKRQRSIGVGDLTLFGSIDVAKSMSRHFDALQVGVAVVLPTASQQTATKLWEIERGHGGATLFDVTLNALFHTDTHWFNPAVLVGGEFSTRFAACCRIPKLITQAEAATVSEVDALLDPPSFFKAHTVAAFEAYDTTVRQFADNVVHTKSRYGARFFGVLSNYAYNIFNDNFRLGLFYRFGVKGEDEINVDWSQESGTFNTALLTDVSDTVEHVIGWNLTYKAPSLCEVNIGSQHCVSGKNVMALHEVFLSLVAVF